MQCGVPEKVAIKPAKQTKAKLLVYSANVKQTFVSPAKKPLINHCLVSCWKSGRKELKRKRTT